MATTASAARAGPEAGAAGPDSKGSIWAPCKESEFQCTDSLLHPPPQHPGHLSHVKAKLEVFSRPRRMRVSM